MTLNQVSVWKGHGHSRSLSNKYDRTKNEYYFLRCIHTRLFAFFPVLIVNNIDYIMNSTNNSYSCLSDVTHLKVKF